MADELGTPPDYTQNGVGPQELPRIVTGTGTRLVKPTRPPGRIAKE